MKTAFSASKRSHLLVLVVFLSCLQISPVTAKEPSLSNSEKNDYQGLYFILRHFLSQTPHMQRLPNPEFNPLKTQPRPLRQNQHPQRVKTWTPTQPPSAHARCPPSPSHTTPDPTCTRSLSPPTPTHLSACIPTPRMMCTMTFRTRPSEC